jgi:hypothetical protein
MREERASRAGFWRQVAHLRQVGRCRASALGVGARDCHAPDCKAEFLGQMFHRLRAAAQKYHLSTLHKYPSSKTNKRPDSREGKFRPGTCQQSNEGRIFIPRYFFSVDSGWEVAKKRLFCCPGTLQPTQPKNFQNFIQSAYLATSPFRVFY